MRVLKLSRHVRKLSGSAQKLSTPASRLWKLRIPACEQS
jgi:hypothetical protein